MFYSITGAHKRLITSPPVAVFPHPLGSDLNFGRFLLTFLELREHWSLEKGVSASVGFLTIYFCRYWNYLRKQTFVLESYATKINWIMNRALFSTHCYLSWGFVAPYVISGIHLAAALRFHFKGYSFDEAVLPSTGECTCNLSIFQLW